MGIMVKVLDPLGVKATGASNDAVNFVSLRNQQFRQIGTILSRDTKDKGTLGFWIVDFQFWISRLAPAPAAYCPPTSVMSILDFGFGILD